MKKFLCWLGIHSFFIGWEEKPVDGDPFGVLREGKCKWCPHHGMIDSQGNLF